MIAPRHWLPCVLIGVYLIAALIYLLSRDYGRALYWSGACILTAGTLLMH